MKIIDKLFRRNTDEDLIVWFENVSGSKYPDQVRKLLQQLVKNPKSVDVQFEALNFGIFQILDFKTLQKARDGHPASCYGENFTNPFFLNKETIDFINLYIPNEHPLKSIDVLPFAHQIDRGDFRYMYFINGIETPLMLDIGMTSSRPRRVGMSINDLIDVSDLINNLKQSKTTFKYKLKPRFEDLIDNDRILVFDGEQVDDVNDYRDLINDLCGITHGELTLNKFEGKEIDDRRILKITINNTEIELDLEGATDWVDPFFIAQLSNALKSKGYSKWFIEFEDSCFGQEMGAVYGNELDYELLRSVGYIDPNCNLDM